MTQSEAREHVSEEYLLRKIHFQSETEESSILQSDLLLVWKKIPELGGIRVGML